MNFDVRMCSDDLLHSVYDFPDDDAVDPNTYRQVVFGGYLSSISTLYGAAKGYGLDIDPETFERWKRIGAAAGLVDDFLDISPDIPAANDLYQAGINSAAQNVDTVLVPDKADPRLRAALQLLSNSAKVLPENKTLTLFRASRQIGAIAVEKTGCSDISRYIKLLEQEACLSAIIVQESASETVSAQPNFGLFATWCCDALEFGTLADSTRDLWADKRSGRINVEATALNSIRIARHALKAARRLYYPTSTRRVSFTGLSARMTFSKLPTKLAMKRYRNAILESNK